MAFDNAGLSYNPLNVEALFNRHTSYLVPQYQRGYSWTSEEVEELLTDLKESFSTFPDDSYLMGQLIVCPSDSPLPQTQTWQLIDGQQRCTTLFLFILRILKNIEAGEDFASLPPFKQNELVAIRTLVSLPDPADNQKFIARIRTASDGPAFVQNLLDDQPLPANDASPTQANIRNAYELIGTHLAEQIGSIEDQWKYLDFVLRHVWVVRLDLTDSNHALRVFLKVNNRGLSLDDADLLKSLLFQKVSSDHDFDELSEQWDKATSELFKGRLKRVKSMEFLMKALIGIRTGRSISSGRVFEEWAKLLDDEQKAKQFAFKLPEKARNLANLSLQKTPLSPSEPAPQSFGTFQFKMVQHFEVLLAGDHLSSGSYTYLSKVVEERAVLSSLAGEKNQDFERVIHKWASKVSTLQAQANLDEILGVSDDALEGIEQLFHDANLGMQKLTYSTKSHHTKLRYVLARVAKFTEGLVAGVDANAPLAHFMSTSSKNGQMGFDLDHVFPQDQSQIAYWDNPEQRTQIDSIGNLVLLHPTDNRSQQNKLPGDPVKVANYGGSSLWVNKILVDADKLGIMPTRVRVAISELQDICPPDLHNWGAIQVEKRAEMYWQILESDMRSNLGLPID